MTYLEFIHSSTYAFDLPVCCRIHTVDLLHGVIARVLPSYKTGGELMNALRQFFSHVILCILLCTGCTRTQNLTNSSSSNNITTTTGSDQMQGNSISSTTTAAAAASKRCNHTIYISWKMSRGAYRCRAKTWSSGAEHCNAAGLKSRSTASHPIAM